MSVVAYFELFDSRTGNVTWQYRRTYLRRFRVFCNLDSDDAKVATSHASLPGLLDSYPTDVFCRVKSVDVKCEGPYTDETTGEGRSWLIDYHYDSLFEFDPANVNENPLLRPAIWKFSWEKLEKAVRFDLDDTPIANSAGTPIDPPLAVVYGIPIINIQVNKAALSYASLADLQDCVNQDTWNGFAPGTVLIRGLQIEKRWENNQLYLAYDWTLAVKHDKWRPVKVLDQGYYEKVSGEQRIIRDKFGTPLPHPTLLDGSGAKLPNGDDPVYLDFNIHRQVNFTGLIP